MGSGDREVDLRVGILGGAFNPPHIGHLVCAQEARWQQRLDRVLLMPIGRPAHREIDPEPGPEERFRLCELAVAGLEGVEASRHEVDSAEPAFTVDTLGALRRQTPRDDLVFILGADQAARLDTWREPQRILRDATIAVADRGGTSRDDVRDAVGRVGCGEDRVRFFDMPQVDVSSTEIRARVAAGRPYRAFVAPAVADRIEERGLYGGLYGGHYGGAE